jgi:RND family efflux transporter MFP subunit
MRSTLFLSLLLLAACSKGEADHDPTPTALVTTVLAARGDMADTVTGYGAAEFDPNAERTLTAPVEAVIAQILAPAGTTVHAGQPVVILKSSPTSLLELNKARADADAAAQAYARSQRLRASGLDSDADVETARAASLAASDAAKSLSARSGAGLTLRAPIDGVVESVAALAPGDVAAQGLAVAKIGAVSGLRVRLGLEAKDLEGLKPGDEVLLTALAGGPAVKAKLAAVDPRLDAQTRQGAVLARAPAGAFAPGQPLRGVVTVRERPDAVVIPRAAVLYDQEQPYVFVVVKDAAHRRDIKLGAEDDDRVAVQGGLTAGERIVVEGAAALDDGMAVREGKAAAPAVDKGE